MNNLIKTTSEIEIMRAGGRILAQVLQTVAAAVKPGISTAALDTLARQELFRLGAEPSFLNYGAPPGKPFPAALCTSVNSGVVHGIPLATQILQAGQIIGLDIGCWYKGMCTDTAITVGVGKISREAEKLIKVTAKALQRAVAAVKPRATLGDIGQAIQSYVEAQGLAVVRQLVGHGVGRAVHEEPAVPNFGKKGSGLKLLAGMTIAIEPMVNVGGYEIKALPDGWSVVTKDGSLSAHFEHTVVVTKQGCEVLTHV